MHPAWGVISSVSLFSLLPTAPAVKAKDGGWGIFRLRAGMGIVSPRRATYFAHVGKVGKTPPGDGVSKNTSCFYAAFPYPLCLALLDISP